MLNLVLTVLTIQVTLLLLLRPLLLWYLRVNRALELLRSIDHSLIVLLRMEEAKRSLRRVS